MLTHIQLSFADVPAVARKLKPVVPNHLHTTDHGTVAMAPPISERGAVPKRQFSNNCSTWTAQPRNTTILHSIKKANNYQTLQTSSKSFFLKTSKLAVQSSMRCISIGQQLRLSKQTIVKSKGKFANAASKSHHPGKHWFQINQLFFN